MNDKKFMVGQPDPKVFKYGDSSALTQVKNTMPVYLIERIEYPEAGGLRVYHEGHLQPTKGFVFPEAMQAINSVKAIVLSYLQIAKIWMMWPTVALIVIVPWKWKIKTLNTVIEKSIRSLQFLVNPYLLKEQYYTEVTREFRRLITSILLSIGITENSTYVVADIVGAIIEYDNAYRYRLQDIMSEGRQGHMIDNPRKELQRIIEIGEDREKTIKGKYRLAYQCIGILLLSKRIKKVVSHAFAKANYHDFKLDEIDRYHTLLRNDYDFEGKTFEDRRDEYVKQHKGVYPQMYLVV